MGRNSERVLNFEEVKMDALEFLRERKRMCIYYGHCEGCPLEKVSCALEQTDSNKEYETVIATVEQWSKEHPRKTRQSVFLEQWPNAKTPSCNLLGCPQYVEERYHPFLGCAATDCVACRREFRGQEVE